MAPACVALLHQWDRGAARCVARRENLWLAGLTEAGAPPRRGYGAERLRLAGGGPMATNITVRSNASATPWGRSAGAHTTVPAAASRVSLPTIILAFPETTR